MTGLTPFTENVWNLAPRNRTGIQSSAYNVVRSLTVDPCFIVSEDTLFKSLEFTPELPNNVRNQMTGREEG